MPKPTPVEEATEEITMRPGRYRRCLEMLRLSHRELAAILGCSEPLPGLWAIGQRSVPPAVAAWLEACVAVRNEHPYPRPPRGWRRSRRGGERGTPGL
jgi:hypothetical protein